MSDTPSADPAAARLDLALDGRAELRRLSPLVEVIAPHDGGVVPFAVRDVRQDLRLLQDPWNPRAVRERAAELLDRFDRHALAAGHPPWWAREQDLLARQHHILRRTRQRRPDPRQRLFHPDAVRAMRELRGLRPGITEFGPRPPQSNRQPEHLLILRRRLAKFVEPRFPEWLGESAAGLLDEFQRRVSRLGYTPWWITNEQQAAAARRQHLEARGRNLPPGTGEPIG